MAQTVDYDQIVADAILEEIETAIKEALAALDGGDSNYYRELYINLQKEQEKIAELTQLPIDVIRKIAALIGVEVAAGIGKELVITDFQYVKDGDEKKVKSAQKNKKDKSNTRKENKERDKDKEKDDVDEEKDLEEAEKDPENLEDLAKLASMKQKNQAKKILKDMLFAMIGSRMDPKQRAGETAQSNVKHAQTYGREDHLTIAQLVKAGVITGVLLDRLQSKGITENTKISVGKVQNIIRGNSTGLFNLVKGIGEIAEGITKIPSKGDSLSILGNVDKSLGIFSSNAQDHDKVKPAFTPFVQQVKGHDRGM
jgi:hypothetical protein